MKLYIASQYVVTFDGPDSVGLAGGIGGGSDGFCDTVGLCICISTLGLCISMLGLCCNSTLGLLWPSAHGLLCTSQ